MFPGFSYILNFLALTSFIDKMGILFPFLRSSCFMGGCLFILKERASYKIKALRAGSQGLPQRSEGTASERKMQPGAVRRRRSIRLCRILFYIYNVSQEDGEFSDKIICGNGGIATRNMRAVVWFCIDQER